MASILRSTIESALVGPIFTTAIGIPKSRACVTNLQRAMCQDRIFSVQPVSREDKETAANDEQGVGLFHLSSDGLHPGFGNVVPEEDNVGLQNPRITLWTAGYPANRKLSESLLQQLLYHLIKSTHNTNPSFNLNLSTIFSDNSTSPSGLSSSHGHPLRSSLAGVVI